MSNTAKAPVSFATLAERYADASFREVNASKRLAEHPDAPALIARAALPKDKGKGSQAATVAREVLGAPADFPTRVGPRGEQVLNPENPVLARRVETLAGWLKAQAPKADPDPTPVLRVTLSGTGGGSATIPTDHTLYAALVALVTGNEEE